MHTRTLTVILFALFLVAGRAEAQFTPRAATVPAEDYHIELGLMLWKPTPELSLTTGNARIGTVDFVQEFGITDDRFREVRGVMKAGKHKVRFAKLPIRYDQNAVLTRTITFQNLTFPVSANGNANIKWDLYRFGYEWDAISASHGFIGLLTEVKYNKIAASVTATGGGLGTTLTGATNVTAPVPTIGGIARGYIGKSLSLTGEFTGFKLDRSSFRGKFYDLDLSGALHLGAHLGVQAGYRSIDTDYRVDNDEGTMKLTGPYFGGFIRY